MGKLKRSFDINLSSLDEGRHEYRYKITQSFFDMFGYDEFDKAEVDVEVVLVKSGNMMEIQMHSEGSVELPDDRTGHLYRQPVSGNLDFIVKYAEEFNDDNEEMILIPYNQAVFNVAQQIYEMIVLGVPMKHLDPEYHDEEAEEEPEIREIDPRWEKLKQLKNKLENQ
jgi:uncharacterized metal-binding protein YceD (DUF177 family)